jgi:hypothetical protein
MAYDQSGLKYIEPTRKEIRKAKREKKKIIKDRGGNIRTMLSEGPTFIQEIRRKRNINRG